MFDAVVLTQDQGGATRAAVEQVGPERLPAGEVEVEVGYSTLNYKDALALTGKGPVVRSWPMVPGIDLAGTVVHSADPAIEVGTRVMVNGHGMGEAHWGGLAQRARVPAGWVTRLPESLTLRDAMVIGTAGYTAMLSVFALERHGVTPEEVPVLVTGANGGVGSFAVALLARRGYEVTASTGRTSHEQRLRSLGAGQVIDRRTLGEPGKPLQKEAWAGAVDSVGSHTLANVCAQTRYDGVVTACGLAQGMDLPATVAPFILRAVTLVGIDSVHAPHDLREQAWTRLADQLDSAVLEEMAEEISLGASVEAAHRLLAGEVRGRIVVDVTA